MSGASEVGNDYLTKSSECRRDVDPALRGSAEPVNQYGRDPARPQDGHVQLRFVMVEHHLPTLRLVSLSASTCREPSRCTWPSRDKTWLLARTKGGLRSRER